MWIEKYRPKNLSELAISDDILIPIEKMLSNSDVDNMIFYSSYPGTGKTSLAYIIANETKAEVLKLNGSVERGIDVVRDKIRKFAATKSWQALKLIFIDEADKLTSDAQDALKTLIEEAYDNVRFIFTCNNLNGLSEPIKSRCQIFDFDNPPIKKVKNWAKTILDLENIAYDSETLGFYVNYFKKSVRKLINHLELNSNSGKLEFTNTSNDESWENKLADMLITGESQQKVLNHIKNNVGYDLKSMFSVLFERSHEFKGQSQAIIILAKYQYQDNFCQNKSIHACSLALELLSL